jgi:predicted O-methyltransferase YrrM
VAELRDPGGVVRIAWRGRELFRWSWRSKLLRRILPSPFDARHIEHSLIASTDDDVPPSERLLNIALSALQRAATLRLDELDRRGPVEAPPSRWPGEHYRLLAALVEVMQPRCVVEIGTASGMSALALKHALPQGGQVATFDLIPWQEYPGACLTERDFADGRLVQHVDDLSDPAGMQRHLELLRQAELIFLDAAKDGAMEPRFFANLRRVPFAKPPLLVLDDIRVWTMLKVWRDLPHPKLDVTSFGHWTGTCSDYRLR